MYLWRQRNEKKEIAVRTLCLIAINRRLPMVDSKLVHKAFRMMI